MQEVVKQLNQTNINYPLVARLRAHMLRKGLNPKTLAERAKVGRSFVYDIINGKSSNPTSSKLSAIAEQLEVSVQYLLSGVHQVQGDEKQGWNDVVEIASVEVIPSASGAMVVSAGAGDARKPYYFKREWVQSKLRARPEDLRVVFVRCDAMNPTLQAGDILLINTLMLTPNPPGIFVLFDGVGLAIKRLEMVTKEKIRVLSDNGQYSPCERELADANILGKVVWLAREM